MTNTSETAERREQILEAALKIFSLKGFQRATNKEIADAAGGISPGLIYHYFTNKEDLFFAIVRERISFVQAVSDIESFIDREPHEVLTTVAHAYLSTLHSPRNVAFFRIIISEAIRFPQLSDAFYRAVIGRVFATLVRYLQHQIDVGHLKPHDPAIAVRSFIGMLIAHIVMREVFHQPEANMVSDDAVVKQVVATFLGGLGK
jgi:AcrR family transcriptional regulator